jgi:tight adherence protein B
MIQIVAVVSIVIGVIGVALLAFNGLVTRLPKAQERRRIERRLRQVVAAPVITRALESEQLVKQIAEGPVPILDRIVRTTTRGPAMARWIEQAGSTMSVSSLFVRAFGLGGILGMTAWLASHRFSVALVLALVGAGLPFFAIRRKRRRRLLHFEEQFPEALDLISRAVRAGHAFANGLKMVADELGDPVGPEFRKIFDEQNFGLPLKEALQNLTERVPLLDVRFFATAVLIQRETGGNLAEILDNLASVVRERFKILRQVRVYTAHGRLTGYVLLGLPVVLAFALLFINPGHINLLFTEPIGRGMLVATVVLQFVGYVWIQRVVKIEV